MIIALCKLETTEQCPIKCEHQVKYPFFDNLTFDEIHKRQEFQGAYNKKRKFYNLCKEPSEYIRGNFYIRKCKHLSLKEITIQDIKGTKYQKIQDS